MDRYFDFKFVYGAPDDKAAESLLDGIIDAAEAHHGSVAGGYAEVNEDGLLLNRPKQWASRWYLAKQALREAIWYLVGV